MFGLDPLPEMPPQTPADKCPPPDEVLLKKIEDIKKLLIDLNPDDTWLGRLILAETAKNNRKGVHGLIDEALRRADTHAELDAERRKLLSTTPEYCSICAFGYAIGDKPAQSIVVGQDGATEEDLLDSFWMLLANVNCMNDGPVTPAKPIVGYNIIGFDLSVLFARSVILGVPSTREIDLTPWKGDVVDVYLSRFGGRGNFSKDRPGKMKDLARLYGVPVPAGDVDGSQVQALYESDPEKVGEYVESDVEICRALHRKFSGMFC